MSIKGLDSFFDVLEVLKTPEVFEQRAKELQEETRKYEEAIQSITKLQSVNDFIKEINLNKQNAKEVLETAHSSAIVIRDAAEKYSREQTQSIREQQRTLAKELEVVVEKEKELLAQQTLIEEKDKFLNDKEASLLKKMQEVESISKELELRKQKYLSILND